MDLKTLLSNADTIVIKVGSMLIRGQGDNDSGVNQAWIDAFAADISALRDQGKNILIVSSGGIALGRPALGIPGDVAPTSIPLELKQAASSVGQFYMFQAYHKALEAQGITAAQILLTMGETENRRMHLNARQTLQTLLDKGIIPVINENDTISTGEIRFGDNDRLAARVAQMIDADIMIILSTIDGLYTDNPQNNPQAEHIPVVENITQEYVDMAGEAIPGLSTGGMKSKVEAAKTANNAGISVAITDGRSHNALQKAIDNKLKNTCFLAKNSKNNARKRWIGAHMQPKGVIFIDKGAKIALKNGKSLLPVGVKRIEGGFSRGDAVAIYDEDNVRIGIGLSAYSASDAIKILGKPSHEYEACLGYTTTHDELVHRNDMVMG